MSPFSEHLQMRLNLGFVINAGQTKAEELHEFAAIARDVSECGKIFGRGLRPDFFDGGLDLGAHFPVVDPDTACFVEGGAVARVQLSGEESGDLFDAALVRACLLYTSDAADEMD
jgi:hypothetical protein